MKRLSLVLALVLSCILLLSACGNGTCPMERRAERKTSQAKTTTVEDNKAYHKITAEEAKKMIDKGGVTVIDVRTEEEYAKEHIPGALLLPNESIGSEPPAELPDKDAVLLLHCRTGVRSRLASEKLIKLGYKQVYDFGGIEDWPYETESEKK